MPEKLDVHSCEPEALQNIPAQINTDQVDAKWVRQGVAPAMLGMDDRKTGTISTDANRAIADHGMTPNT
jgi:hypothetical protein